MRGNTVQACAFVVDETPYCLWDWNLPELNLEFLDSVDPTYFRHIAEIHHAALGGEHGKHAALAIRLAYSQALETFFALIAAVIQAPQCPLGYVLKYQVRDLRNVIAKVHRRRSVLTRLNSQPTWESLSQVIHSFRLSDTEREGQIKAGFAWLWGRFAGDFLDERSDNEYNGIKHGLRARSGGFTLAIGLESSPGVPAPADAMQVIGSSEHGSSYYVAEGLSDVKLNLRARRASRNWDPNSLALGLMLLAMSIENALAFLKIASGRAPSEVRFSWPSDLKDFERPWEFSPGVTAADFSSTITAADIKPMTKSEVLESYIEYRTQMVPEQTPAPPGA